MKTEDFEKHLICLLWLFCFSFDDPYFSGSGVSPEIFHHNDGWQGGEIIREPKLGLGNMERCQTPDII